MTAKQTIEVMRSVVNTYDKVKDEKQRLKDKADNVLESVKEMKVGTVIEIAVGIFLLVSVCAAVAYCCLKGCPIKKKAKKEANKDLYDEFPEGKEPAEEQPLKAAEEPEE